MTNLLILTLQLIHTNIFPIGCKYGDGGTPAAYCWNVELTYTIPTNLTPSVWVVESTDTPEGVTIIEEPPWGTLYIGQPWQEINTSTQYPNLDLGHFTNTWTGTVQTNRIRFPVPDGYADGKGYYYRMKRVR
jgi:hypothetical protein